MKRILRDNVFIEDAEFSIKRRLVVECYTCDMQSCGKQDCIFRNGTISYLFKMNPRSFKHWILFFYQNPKYNWCFPTNEPRKWCIHHIDRDHYNDTRNNTIMMDYIRHRVLHNEHRNQMSEKIFALEARSIRILYSDT